MAKITDNREVREISVEAGTNKCELMEFTISGNYYGINVAKVREIMLPSEVVLMPRSHPCVEGVFKPRESIITIIDLPHYLGLCSENKDKTLIIVTNFNNMNVAFRVHTVTGIKRVSWADIEKPDKTIYGKEEGSTTGIAKCADHMITVLDFEKIVADISPASTIQSSEIEALGKRVKDSRPILIAEDSELLSKLIIDCLNKAEYTNVIPFSNGQDAWNFLMSIEGEPNVRSKVACIVTDIEMPKMDGHTLTKNVKGNAKLKEIPLIIFSSLINEDMYKTGQQLGADEQISKPEIASLVGVMDRLICE